MAYEGLEGNKNAEKWTLEEALKTLNEAKAIAKDQESYMTKDGPVTAYKYHFLGEIAAELDLYSDVFKYLGKLYPECYRVYTSLKTRLEANCFSDSKKGVIREATAIMNLKSNYGWTDRVANDNNHSGNVGIVPWTVGKKSNESDQ